MSYILDALKKAERARQQQQTDRSLLDRVITSTPAQPVPRWRGPLTLVLLVNALVLGWLLLPYDSLFQRRPAADSSAAPAMTAEPVESDRRLLLPDDPLEVLEPVTLNELPPTLRERFATLNLDLHVYGDRPEQRFVLINSQRYRTGDWLTEGPLLEAIVPEGVILSYRDARFRLSAQP